MIHWLNFTTRQLPAATNIMTAAKEKLRRQTLYTQRESKGGGQCQVG